MCGWTACRIGFVSLERLIGNRPVSKAYDLDPGIGEAGEHIWGVSILSRVAFVRRLFDPDDLAGRWNG